jgi:hypothetical protein
MEISRENHIFNMENKSKEELYGVFIHPKRPDQKFQAKIIDENDEKFLLEIFKAGYLVRTWTYKDNFDNHLKLNYFLGIL